MLVPKGFIPEQDTDQIAVTTEAAQGTSYDKLVEYQDQSPTSSAQNPNVEGLVSTIGGSAAATLGGPNLGQIVVHLKPRGERKELATDIIAQAAAADREGRRHARSTCRIRRRSASADRSARACTSISMQSPDREQLYAAARKLQKALGRRPGPRGSDERPRDHQPAGQRRDRPRQGGGARRHREPDRERVLRRLRPALGLDDLRAGQRIQGAARAGAAVPGRSGGAVAALLQVHAAARAAAPTQRRRATPRRRRRRPPRTRPAARSAACRPRTTATGTVVPLDTLAHMKQVVGPQTVNHHGQLPAVTISFGLAPGASLGDVLTRVREVADQTLPDTVTGSFQGAAKAFQSSLEQPRGAARHRDHGRLHRARHPLRELHPPADDSFGSARRRRSARWSR